MTVSPGSKAIAQQFDADPHYFPVNLATCIDAKRAQDNSLTGVTKIAQTALKNIPESKKNIRVRVELNDNI
jgi:hypothetical protein